MINLTAGDTARTVFSISETPDSAPVVTVYGDGELLGTATVSAATGVNAYEATFSIPMSIASGVLIEMRANAQVDGQDVSTLVMIAGIVGYVSDLVDRIERDGGMMDGIRSVLSGITRLSSWLRAALRADPADAVAMSEINVGGGEYDPAIHSLEAVTGSGDRVVTLTVQNDSSEVVSGAKVTLQTSAGVTIAGRTAVTDINGEVTFNLDDGDYKGLVTIATGYQTHTAEAFAVDEDNETVTLTITANTITPPSDPMLANLVVKCVDEAGAPQSGVDVVAKMITPPSGTGYAFDGAENTGTSDANGDAVLRVVRGAKYQIKRGDNKTCREFHRGVSLITKLQN